VDRAELAMGYFGEAAAVYGAALRGREDSPASSSAGRGRRDRRDLRYDYAVVLHNLATASTYRNQEHESVAKYAKEAIDSYQIVLDQLVASLSARGGGDDDHDDRASLFDIRSAVGDLLFTSSGSLLRLGRYEESRAAYRSCVQWHERHQLPAPPAAKVALFGYGGAAGSGGGGGGGDDGLIEEYELALEAYRDSVAEQAGAPYEGADDEELQYDPALQDGYEGDLHMSLGSLYLSQGDTYAAASHLQQAVQLYERSDEAGDVSNAADVKLTLSELHFTNGDYRAAVQLHEQALDLYRRAHGDGVNPMEDAAMKLEPTVKFQLDPVEELIVEKNLAKAAETDTASKVLSAESSGQDLAASASTGPSSIASKSEGGDEAESVKEEPPERRRSDDPMLALVDYWYAALAKEAEGEEQGKGPPANAPRAEEL
jgi:tetratricopeptide (TPR) repeat protein